METSNELRNAAYSPRLWWLRTEGLFQETGGPPEDPSPSAHSPKRSTQPGGEIDLDCCFVVVAPLGFKFHSLIDGSPFTGNQRCRAATLSLTGPKPWGVKQSS